jgi:hypothetical protein
LLTALSGLLMPAANFKQYPDAKPSARPVAVADPEKKDGDKKADKAPVIPNDASFFATPADFARVAYFFRAIGKEQKMPDGMGDGTARATFTFDSGETVLIMHPRPTGDPIHDQTFIEVTKTPKAAVKPEPAKQVLSKPALPAAKAMLAKKK